MAEIFVPGRVSGQQYRVRIAGDQPTAQERDKISAFVAQREAEFSQQFEQTFGQAPVAPDYGKMAFGRGLERGLPQTRELLGTALRATGEATGIGALRDFGAGQEEAAQQRLFDLSFRQPARTGLDDVSGVGSALTFAGETLGENIPQLAGSVAGALGATALAKPLTAAGALAAGTAGGAATSFPILFGGNVQRQEQEVEGGGLEERDLGRALISAFGQSALEGVAASILALRPFRAAPGSGLFTRVGVGAGVGVPSEGLTEIGQTMIERAQAGLPIDSPDAIKEYIEAGVAGGILGGTFGGVAGALPGERPVEAPPEPITDPARLLSPPALGLPAPDTTPARSDISVDPDVADAQGYFEERAGILEFDAQLSRPQAEAQAARDTLTYLQSTGQIDSPQLRPTVRALRNKAAVEPETGPPTPPIEAYAEDLGVDLRQQGLPIAPATETQVAPEAPTAETVAPTTGRTPNADLVNLLQELQVPRTARVSQLVRNGTVNDMAGFRDALSRFAAATTPERKARATQWLQTSREQPTPDPAAETDVRNTTLEPEVQADVEATQEVQDAQTAPSGPVEPDPTPDRTGIEGGIAELDTGEVTIGADPAGAEPSVGGAVGQPVLGPREPDAPAGEQPATLRSDLADLFDDSTIVAGDEVFTPAQPGPFEAAGMTPMGDGRTWTMDQGGYTYRVRTLPRVSPDDELQRVAARINRTTGEIEPISTNTRVAEMMADMAEAGWQLPASAQGLYPDMARDAIAARGVQPAAIEAPAQPTTPEAATADQGTSMPESIPVGPGAIRPRPIGGTLYSDMSQDSLNKLLRELLVPSTTSGYVGSRWFSDNADLALGQGANTGVLVEFDGDLVSGRPSQSKPGISAGMVEGSEFQSDYINENAIRTFTLGPDQKLPKTTNRLVNEKFDAVKNPDGSTTYRRKGLAPARQFDQARFAESVRRASERGYMAPPDTLLEQSDIDARMAMRRGRTDVPGEATIPDINVTPGQVTGAGPQVIPPPVAPAPRFTPEGAAIDPLVAEAAAAQEAQDKVAAQDTIDAWYEANASLELKAGRARIAGTSIEPSVMPAADMEAVVALLRKAPKQGKGGRITPERAAFVYFSKSPDTNFALESIAYDQAQKMSTDYKSREADFRRESEFDSPDEAAFYKGTGAEVAMRAARWIRDNLSEGTRKQVADYTFNKYRPIDYEAAAERRDVRRAQARNQQAEVDKIIRDTYGDTTLDTIEAADLGFAAEDLRGYDLSSFAGRTEWPSSVHPRVAQLIAAGDLRGALQGLAVTSPNPNLRTLAERLAARVQDTPTQVVPAATMNRIRATMSPETPTLGVETPAGVYVHPMSPDALAAMRREGHEEAASIVEEFGGQILFNENTSLAPELVMHEAVHAIGDQVLTNKSHPLTRQLDKLRTELLKFMPATNYGLSNVREFFAEGMTNPAFRQQLSYATTEGKPYSAWDNFKNIVRNWMRGLVGRQPIKPDSALTSLDRALDAVLAMNPNEMGAGSVVGASFAPGGAQQVIRDAFERTRVPNSGDLQRMRNLLQNSRVPASWKGALMRLAMPLDYVGDAASKYLPSARRVHDLVMQQQAAIQKGSTMVMQTTEATAKVLGKYRRDQSVIDNFNRVLFEASRLQIDPRKSRSDYEGYSFQYNVLDADGNIVRRVESKKFANEADRNQAIRDYNSKLTAEQRRNPVARAKRLFDETPEGLQDYDRLRGIYQSLPTEVKSEASRMFALQPAVGKELVDAIRARLEALLPQQRALQDKVFGMIYDKMLSGQLLDPYVALRRQGEFWLSYSAVDPNSVTTDPATGQPDYSNAQIEQFKHSFQTQAQRDAAIAALQQLPPEQQVSNLEPYQNVGSRNARPNVPLEFVSGVLDAIDTSEALTRAVDPTTGAGANIRQQVIELMFDTLPESSFMNSFKKRAGIRGFIGDVTPLTEGMSAGDTVKNLRESAMRISRQATDLKYGAEFAAARKALTDEATQFQNTNPQGLPTEELSRQRAEASQYYDLLTEYTSVPFRQRSALSRSLTGGAYMLTLGFNVSTALITLSQVPLFVAPFLSGKHGMGRTMAAIGEANRLITGSGRERTIERIGTNGQVEQVRVPVRIWDYSLDNYDFSDPANRHLETLHRVAKDNGVFNRSLMQDELLGEQPTVTQKIAASTGIMQHHAERYSRETALMAAYHLELQDAMGQQNVQFAEFVAALKSGTIQPSPEQAQRAAEAAVNVSEKTNGPIYAAAGPMASQNDFGAIVYLFKRHPLSMLNLIGQTAMRANPFGTNDPNDRKIAQRQFGAMMGTMSLMSGALGLPLMQQVGWLYDSLFTEDDEPDFDTMVRTTLGEAGAFGLIDYVTGTKVSERIGLGGAIYRPGFASERLPVPYQVLEGVGGPVLGLGLKYLDRAPKLLEQGEYWRFGEAVAPSALGNFLRSVRFNTEGIRTMRGDPVVDDIGPFHIAAQALGFMPAQYAQRLAMNSMGTRINNAIDTKRRQLLQQLNKARRDGDMDTVRRVNEEIQEFNQRHPNNPITGETRRSSMRAFNDMTARTNYGLAVSPRNQAYIQSLTDAYGPSSLFD